MPALLDRRLLVVTGKGGVGKTTVAAALGMLAAQRGRRALVVELGRQSRLPQLFGVAAGEQGMQTPLLEGLSSLTVDPDRALLEWLQALGGRVSGRILASSGTFQYFAAAAPGARELVAMVKVWRLVQGRRAPFDVVILDAPATGHALGLLRSPQTFGAIARVGPVAHHAKQVQELLADPLLTGYVGVTHGTDMAVTETLELQEGLEATTGQRLCRVVLNELLPRRFTAAELRRLAPYATGAQETGAQGQEGSAGLLAAAVDAAREVHARAVHQHGQVARLRRRNFAVVGLPYLWRAGLDRDALSLLAARLAYGLGTELIR